MEKTSALATHHWQSWITFTIYFSDRNPIGLHIVRHKTFEIHVQHLHFPPWQSSNFLRREFELCSLQIVCHNTQWSTHTILVIVHMIYEGGPVLEMFDMVNHYPWIFHISSNKHMLNKIYTTPLKVYKHFKAKYFVFGLARNLLQWMYLKLVWYLSAIILSINFIPLQTKCLEPQKKLQQFGEARVLNLFMTTSKNQHARWCPSITVI